LSRTGCDNYVLVTVNPGKDRDVCERIVNMPEVKEAVQIYGEYDLILRVEVKDFNELDHFVFDTLRTIDGVNSTKTLIGTKKLK
jgi:DNA-binding Lrp family transcriptional regulator